MLNRLRKFQAQGKLPQAEATFHRIVAEMPEHIFAWMGLGYCAILKGDPDTAVRAFERAIAIGPADDVAAIDCSTGLDLIGRGAKAREVLAARPESLHQQLSLGDLEVRHGNDAVALLHYQAAHALEPGTDSPLRKIIAIHRRHRDFAAAHAAADCKNAPNNDPAQGRGKILIVWVKCLRRGSQLDASRDPPKA
jgi:tetratricopeptide (TPR) repeat protein